MADVPHFKAELISEVLDDIEDNTDKIVLREYFGLRRSTPKSLATIGERLGVTPQRVGQIKQRAVLRAIELLKEKELI